MRCMKWFDLKDLSNQPTSRGIKSNTILQRIKVLDKTIKFFELNIYKRSSKIKSLVVQDLLTDLMHYCYRDTKTRCDNSKILIFDDILEKARNSFWIETKEAGKK